MDRIVLVTRRHRMKLFANKGVIFPDLLDCAAHDAPTAKYVAYPAKLYRFASVTRIKANIYSFQSHLQSDLRSRLVQTHIGAGRINREGREGEYGLMVCLPYAHLELEGLYAIPLQ